MNLKELLRAYWLILIFGMVLFIGGTTVLFWNEGRAVRMIMSLNEAVDYAITLYANADKENTLEYNERIVHICGPLVIGEPLTEPTYNVQVLAVKLKRYVQMYQWVEGTVEHNYGDSASSIETEDRTYYYTLEWRDHLIDSRQFYLPSGHNNPKKFPIESVIHTADAVYINGYELGTEVKNKFNDYIELASDTRPEDLSIKLHLGLYYHSNDVFRPEVGDIRLLFYVAGLEGQVYSAVGKLHRNKIVPYISSHGVEVLLVYPGELTLMQLFNKEHRSQRLILWGFRFMGWVLMFFAVTSTSTLLQMLFHRTKLLAVLAPNPQNPICGNVLLSLSMTLVITSIAWVLHRPMIGAGLIFAAASPLVWFVRGFTNYQRVE